MATNDCSYEKVLLAMKGNDLPFLQSIYKTCIAKIKETSLVAPGDMVGLLEKALFSGISTQKPIFPVH